jgi:hypothetical protein
MNMLSFQVRHLAALSLPYMAPENPNVRRLCSHSPDILYRHPRLLIQYIRGHPSFLEADFFACLYIFNEL